MWTLTALDAAVKAEVWNGRRMSWRDSCRRLVWVENVIFISERSCNIANALGLVVIAYSVIIVLRMTSSEVAFNQIWSNGILALPANKNVISRVEFEQIHSK